MTEKIAARIVTVIAVLAAGAAVSTVSRRRATPPGAVAESETSATPAPGAVAPAAAAVVQVDPPLPPLPESDSERDRRIRSLAAEGKALWRVGRPDDALRRWADLREVDRSDDAGALCYVRLLEAHGRTAELTRFLGTDFPANAGPAFYQEAAAFYLREGRFREAHHCFEELARQTGEAGADEMKEACFHLAIDGGDAEAARRVTGYLAAGAAGDR